MQTSPSSSWINGDDGDTRPVSIPHSSLYQRLSLCRLKHDTYIPKDRLDQQKIWMNEWIRGRKEEEGRLGPFMHKAIIIIMIVFDWITLKMGLNWEKSEYGRGKEEEKIDCNPFLVNQAKWDICCQVGLFLDLAGGSQVGFRSARGQSELAFHTDPVSGRNHEQIQWYNKEYVTRWSPSSQPVVVNQLWSPVVRERVREDGGGRRPSTREKRCGGGSYFTLMGTRLSAHYLTIFFFLSCNVIHHHHIQGSWFSFIKNGGFQVKSTYDDLES